MTKKTKRPPSAAADWLLNIALVAALLALLLAVLWYLTGRWSPTTWRWLVVLSPFALVGAFFTGFYFGKVEVRGFLGGFDRALDGLTKAVDLRDHSRARLTASRQVPPTATKIELLETYLPARGGDIPLTYRAADNGRVIDL